MATYCFRCPVGHKLQLNDRDVPACGCGRALQRDYRAESVGVAVTALRNEREHGGREGVKNLFLPTNRDFAGPGDPDGSAGMREWRDTHQPKAGNKNPDWPGSVEKKVW